MSWKKYARGSALAALAFAIAAPVAYAQQTTTSIRGDVRSGDQAIAGATVVLVHTPSGTRSSVTTNASGSFNASGLRVGGPFSITISAPGYQTTSAEDIFTTLDEPFALAVDLPTARTTDTVIVTAASLGRGRGDGTGSNQRRDDIAAVVSITRDIRDIARRDMLVTQNSRGDGGISIAGSNPRTNRITIDGVTAQDDFGLNTGGLPTRRGPISLDAVEQVSVQATPFDASDGSFTGGAFNVVLRSGKNKFEGAAFVNYLNDGLVGTRIGSTPFGAPQIPTRVSQENYGGFISGPIIKDKLFFALSYETFTSLDVTTTGPTGENFGTNINGVTSADIENIRRIFTTNYATKFDIGSIPRTKPITDEKYSAKIDWNITDRQRASFTYRNAESTLIQRTNISSTSAGLDSQWYLTGEKDQSYVAELNSDWSDNFSTRARLAYRDYTRLQQPPSGQEFADISVCNSAGGAAAIANLTSCENTTSVIRFGPDEFRHANFLQTKKLQGQIEGTYIWGNHTIKGGYQYQNQDVFNLFVAASNGVYYFDTVADFAAGRANSLRYNNAVNGNKNSAAAAFTYDIHSLYLQDRWDITDELTVQAGLRYDMYKSSDKPALNPNFVARYGFNNQETYDGRSVLMPRLSFNYVPEAFPIRLSGGIGLYSGGAPDVWLSNSFSNTGILTNSVTIQRLANGTFIETTGAPGFNAGTAATLGATALNVSLTDAKFGFGVPSAIQTLLGGAVVSPLAPTASIAPSFDIPSDYKFNLSAKVDLFGIRWGVDAVITDVNRGLAARDIRANRLVIGGTPATLPDGRIRYDGVVATAAQRTAANVTSANLGSNTDIQLYNVNEGRGYVFAVSADKSFDNGVDVQVSYATQDLEEFTSSSRFSSTPTSLYNSQPTGRDPNTGTLGVGTEQIEGSLKANISWRKEFIQDLETRFTLFGERRSGRPFSITMRDSAPGRSPVFGVVGKANTMLAYVPNFAGWDAATDPTRLNFDIVTFSDAATRDQFVYLVRRFNVPQGGIAPKSSARNPDVSQLDFQFSQELPGFFSGHRSRVTFDVANVLNLLNPRWGRVEEFNDTNRIIDVACATATGAAVAAGDFTCARYRYSAANTTAATSKAINNERSRWFIQIGLRYEF